MRKEEVGKKKIIVYDFDKTLYDGETGVNFSVFYLKKYPVRSILFMMGYSKDLIFYLLKIIDLRALKERYFEFLERHLRKRLRNWWLGFGRLRGIRFILGQGRNWKKIRRSARWLLCLRLALCF